MEERTFFEHEDVKVTNSRFITGGQTYAMHNVTSVKSTKKEPNRTGGMVVFLLGLALAVGSPENPVFGVILIIGAAYYLYQQKTTYHIMLTTSGGETSALTTHQPEYLNKVISALNEAIVYRG